MASSNKRARDIERARYERQRQRRSEAHAARRRRTRTVGIVVAAVAGVAVVGVVALLVHGTGGGQASATASGSASTSSSASSSATGTASAVSSPTSLAGLTAATCASPSPGSPGTKQYSSAPSMSFPPDARVTLTLHTTCGDIAMDLDAAKAPKTVASMVTLADKGFFDHTKCHRLTDEGIYVLQCGDPTGTGSGGPGYTLPDENLPKAGSDGQALYPAGTIAMANTGSPHTGGSQFFLVYQDTYLSPSYTVLGTMTPQSLKVVREIAKAGVAGGAGVTDGAPAANVVINGVSVTGAPSAASP
ncbi:MAG TPA: peptidylprolyl isomerase [Actinomycetes bacterium]|nr:peptidylprolyl isomerase [Actinomycetes bacterium]